MKIRRTKRETIPFGVLMGGDVFNYLEDSNCEYCIKLDHPLEGQVTAISLIDGTYVFMKDEDEVVPLNVELVDLDKEN